MKFSLQDKIAILADSAKYDVSCSSSGSDNNYKTGELGNTHKSGICHTFTSDGRCVSLLKVLLTNFCIYDCAYCINRVTNDIPRASFSPKELNVKTVAEYVEDEDIVKTLREMGVDYLQGFHIGRPQNHFTIQSE